MELSVKQPSVAQNISKEELLTVSKITTNAVSKIQKKTNVLDTLDEYRTFLLPALLMLQGAILSPAVLLVTSFIDLGLAGAAIGIMVVATLAVLVTNIAGTSIKAILATFAVSFLASIILIVIHLLSLV